MDKLEKFINENREKLDQYEPPENGWNGIKHGVAGNKRIIPTWLSAAAMAVLLIGISAILYSSYRKKDTYYQANDPARKALRETEAYYNSLVTTLYREAKPLLTSEPDLAKELDSDIAQVDNICADLKKDLKDNVANREVIEALIQNYRIKLQILEEMLSLLKQNENKKDKPDSHEL
jgi:CHASE3 domain sensor protein